MTITLNGSLTELPPNATLLDVLETAGYSPEAGGIAVALNDAVVPRSQWGKTGVPANATVEIVTAQQGG